MLATATCRAQFLKNSNPIVLAMIDIEVRSKMTPIHHWLARSGRGISIWRSGASSNDGHSVSTNADAIRKKVARMTAVRKAAIDIKSLTPAVSGAGVRSTEGTHKRSLWASA